MRPSPIALLCALAPLPLSAQAQVWVVDDDGPADFADLQPAVDAAADGDVVIARAGTYASFTVAGKGLSLLGDESAEVIVLGATGAITSTVSGVPAGSRVVVRGLTFRPPSDLTASQLVVEGCTGVVWLEDLVVEGAFPAPFVYMLNQAEALTIREADHVVLSSSVVNGSGVAPPGQGLESGSRAMHVEDSEVHVHASTLRAGGSIALGGLGLAGVRVDDGALLALRDSTVIGGQGGEGDPFGGSLPGNGGPALQVLSGEAWSIGSTLHGGSPGTDIFGGSGSPGPPYAGDPADLNEHAAEAATLVSSSIVRDDDPVDDDAHFDLTTVPGSTVFLLASFVPEPVLVTAFPEVVGGGLAPIVVPAGVTDALGQLSMSVGIPTLPPGVETWHATIQMAVFTPTPDLELSNPTVLTVVDEAF